MKSYGLNGGNMHTIFFPFHLKIDQFFYYHNLLSTDLPYQEFLLHVMEISEWTPTLKHGTGQFLWISSASKTKSFLIVKAMFETI